MDTRKVHDGALLKNLLISREKVRISLQNVYDWQKYVDSRLRNTHLTSLNHNESGFCIKICPVNFNTP